MAASESKQGPELQALVSSTDGTFVTPSKKINEANDVTFFLRSKAYADLLTFLLQLNASMFPRVSALNSDELVDFQPEEEQALEGAPPISKLSSMLSVFEGFIEQAPPDPGPRRFGNVSFRKWYDLLEGEVDEILDTYLPERVLSHEIWLDRASSPKLELRAYLLGSFGSAQRLDYGTGHELSFLAFLASVWKLDGFASLPALKAERAIVLGVIGPYLALVRRLIQTYNLEPAGSHGVWGLDDHSFLPYIFGSAQLSPPIRDVNSIPAEGSSADAPDPSDVTKIQAVEQHRDKNLYFGAIGFIYDVKKGPFWEHSPTLYDISGVKAGWAKINKGMIKMFIGEVLSKFPVVQHFPFGNIFKWEHDPSAPPIPSADKSGTSSVVTKAPKPLPTSALTTGTSAPRASAAPPSRVLGIQAGRQPVNSAQTKPSPIAPSSSGSSAQTRAPWAKD